MQLTKTHLELIKEGLVKLDCYDCWYSEMCHDGKHNTFCKEIGEWVEEQENKTR